jgi:RecA-family ATPase
MEMAVAVVSAGNGVSSNDVITDDGIDRVRAQRAAKLAAEADNDFGDVDDDLPRRDEHAPTPDDVPHAADASNGSSTRHSNPTDTDTESQQAKQAEPQWLYAPALSTWLGDEEEPGDNDDDEWLIRDLVPRGEQSLNAGSPMVGKTTFEMMLALAIVLGQDFGKFRNCLGRPGRVLMLLGEDSKRRLVKKLWRLARGLGVTPRDERILAGLRIGNLMLRVPDRKAQSRFVSELARWRPDAVVVDSLSRSMVGSQNDIADVTTFTTEWQAMTVELVTSFRYLHHTNKPTEARRGDPFDSIRGSRELLAAPRHAMVMERLGDDNSGITAVHMRSNLTLQRKSFALGYEEHESEGRAIIRLHDRGDIESVQRELKDAHRERKEAETQTAFRVEQQRRRTIAMEIVRRDGSVSSRTLAEACGLKSAQSVAGVLADLVKARMLDPDRKLGYVLSGGAQ